MERKLLVTHRLSQQSGGTTDIAGLLERFGEWIEAEPSVYVLWTKVPWQQVYKQLHCTLGRSDELAVADITDCPYDFDTVHPPAAERRKVAATPPGAAS